MLLLPNSQLDQAEVIADDLRIRISELTFEDEKGEPFRVTASFGVSEVNEKQSLSDLYSAVDKLLYRAKQNGRNRVETTDSHRKNTDISAAQGSGNSVSDKMHRISRRMRRLKFRFAQHFS